MYYRIVGIVSLLCALCPEAAQAQADTQKVSFFPLPIIYYTPETEWAFGLGGVLAVPTGSAKKSQIQIGGAYTLRKQLLLYLPFQLFLREDRLRIAGELGYYKYRYFYYGIGNGYTDYDGETYDVTYPRLRLNTLWPVADRAFLGGRVAYDDFRITAVAANGLLDTVPTIGSEGSVYAALGPVFSYDGRDHPYFPTKGWFINASVLRNDEWVGSNLSYWQWELDVRKYYSQKTDRVWAWQLFLGGRAGDTPFNQLVFLGGGNLLRGYIEGQYRDQQGWITQAEYRFPLKGRLAAVVFGGLGGVSDSWTNWQWSDVRWAAGAGLRFDILPRDRIRFRLDYGIGQNSSGIYLTVGEAF